MNPNMSLKLNLKMELEINFEIEFKFELQFTFEFEIEFEIQINYKKIILQFLIFKLFIVASFRGVSRTLVVSIIDLLVTVVNGSN